MKSDSLSISQHFAKSAAVFIRAGKLICGEKFLIDIAAFQKKILSTNQKRWVLAFTDSYYFAAAVLAVLSCQRELVLLPNNQIGTLADFANSYDNRLNDDDVVLSDEIFTLQHDVIDAQASVIFYTSGTTGKPKKVIRQVKNLMAEVDALEQVFGDRLQKKTIYSTASHQHIYGFLFHIFWPLIMKRTISCTQIEFPEQVVALAQNEKSVALISSPAILKRINSEKIAIQDFMIFSSGGLLPWHAAKNIKEIFSVIPFEVLGSTETGGVGYRQQHIENQSWKKFPEIEITTHQQCLQVSSPFNSENHPIIMGDKVTIHESGLFTLHERADRIVKIEEKRLSLPTMENKLQEHLFVTSAYVLLYQTQRQAIAAIIELSDIGQQQLPQLGQRKLKQILVNHLAQFFDRIVLPKKIRFVSQIPINTQGKYCLNEMHKLLGGSHENS